MADTLLGNVNNNTDGQEVMTSTESTELQNESQETVETSRENNEKSEQQDTVPPTVPERYDFTSLGEVDTAIAEEFSGVLKTIGATQEQAQAIATYGLKYAQQVLEAQTQVRESEIVRQASAWEEETKAELGSQFDVTMASAGIAMDYLEKKIPNIRDIVNENGIGNRIEIVRMFAAVGEALREDNGKGNQMLPTGEIDAAKILYPTMK